jgi:hypothetical protein
MIRRSRVIRAAMVFVVFLAARAQTTAPPSSVPVGSSQEPAVIDSTSTKIAFDNDGNIAREQTTRVLVQTDAGVQRWGLLTFPFQSATQTVEIDYVRVRKPDGTTLTTPPDNVQDLDAEITRSAPFYSDLREKHVAVKGLGKGDTLEYQAHWHAIKPLIPGQFWFQYSFQHTSVVLDERIEIKVPAGRAVKAKDRKPRRRSPQNQVTASTPGPSPSRRSPSRRIRTRKQRKPRKVCSPLLTFRSVASKPGRMWVAGTGTFRKTASSPLRRSAPNLLNSPKA